VKSRDSPTAVNAPHNASNHIGSEFPAPEESRLDGEEEGEVRPLSPGKLGRDMMPEVTAAAAKVAAVRRGECEQSRSSYS
jgi:hypothetical protein